jgi:hypothetical protein
MSPALIHRSSGGNQYQWTKLWLVDVLWVLLALGLCAGLMYLGYRIEPHYVSKDGRRFLCTGQQVSTHGIPDGRRREVRISVLPDGQLQMDVKRGMRLSISMWTLEGKSAEPPPRRAVYVLRGNDEHGATQRMIIRMPLTSRAVTTLDTVLAPDG